MTCTAESCKDGLTPRCFEECPEWAKRAFACRLLHLLTPGKITNRLARGLEEALIAPGVDIPSVIIFPPGTTFPPGTIFPPGWSAGDPAPAGIVIPPGTTFPPGWSTGDPLPPGIIFEPGATFPPGWSPGDELPPGVLRPPLHYVKPPKLISDPEVISPIHLGLGPGALLSGQSNTAAVCGAGCGCCNNKDNPTESVGIGYEDEQMELSETQELTVTDASAWCEGHFYEWMITSGGGELSADEGLSLTYTAPTNGHGCPGNTEITLYCCGEVMATLDITINYNYAIEYNYETSAEEIDRNTSEPIYVTANNTPLSWSVAGTGFSLEHAETDSCGNILHADETACGPATITVTGCDSQETIGYVRCTTGDWVLINNECVMPGPGEVVLSANYYDITQIQGNKKQVVRYRVWLSGFVTKSHPIESTALSLAIAAAEEKCVANPCMSYNVVDCSALYEGVNPISLGCNMNNLGCRNAGNCVWNEGTEKWDCTVDYTVYYSKFKYYYNYQC